MLTSMSCTTKSTGRIALILGPMMSGKTTELIRRARRAKLANQKVCVIKFVEDTRYEDKEYSVRDVIDGSLVVVKDTVRQTDSLGESTDKPTTSLSTSGALISHNLDATIADFTVARLMPLLDALTKSFFQVICIDEGQFYPDLVEFCEQLANVGKHVIIAGLSGDYKREMFTTIANLLPKCEQVDFLDAVCKCGKDAPFTYRTIVSDEQKIIGGSDMYKAHCRACWSRETENQTNKRKTTGCGESKKPKLV